MDIESDVEENETEGGDIDDNEGKVVLFYFVLFTFTSLFFLHF